MESSIGGFKGEIDKIIIVPLLGFTILGNYALAVQFYSVLMIAVSMVVFKYLITTRFTVEFQNPKLKKITSFIFDT